MLRILIILYGAIDDLYQKNARFIFSMRIIRLSTVATFGGTCRLMQVLFGMQILLGSIPYVAVRIYIAWVLIWEWAALYTCTCLTLGTTRPSAVSMAIPMLWSAFSVIVVHSASTTALRMGWW